MSLLSIRLFNPLLSPNVLPEKTEFFKEVR
jgi:hypothetical protein